MAAQILDATRFATAARDPAGFAAAAPRVISGTGFSLAPYGLAALRR